MSARRRPADGGPRHSGVWPLRIGLASLLGLVFPIYLGVVGRSATSNSNQFLLFLVIVVSGCCIAWSASQERPRLIALSFWIYVYIWVGLAPLAQIVQSWPLYGTYDEGQIRSALWLSVLGILSWLTGYRLARGWGLSARPGRTVQQRRVDRLTYISIASTLLLIMWIGPIAFVSSREKLFAAVNSRAGGVLAQSQLVLAAVIVPPCAALCLRLWGRDAPGWRASRGGRRLTATLAVLALFVANPISNPRLLSGSILISIVLAARGRRRNRRFDKLFAIGLIGGVVFLFPIADAFRFESSKAQLSISADRTEYLSGDYDAFQQTMNGLDLAKQSDAFLGRQTLSAALFFVPRAVWEAKAEPTGVLVARHAGYQFENLSAPLWLEGYMDARAFGAIALCIGFGALARRLDRALHEQRFSLWSGVATVYVGYQLVILRGSLLGVIQFLATWALIVWVVTKPATSE